MRLAATMEIIDYDPTIDAVLDSWIQRLGRDYAAYRGHVYRVFNYTRALTKDASGDAELVAIAAAFHDLGIWSDSTLDYLEPSAKLAADYVGRDERRAWTRTIELMIVTHHKLGRYRGEEERLVEAFRRADLCDLSYGALRSGVDRGFVREVNAHFPDQGFRARVTGLVLRWAVSHPRRPLPMMRL